MDFYAPAVQLGIEVDGPEHDVLRDADRDAILARLGIDVLRFANDTIQDNLHWVLASIHQAVDERRREV